MCPRCGKFMVKQMGDAIYCSYPPQWDEQWRCGCGYASGWERVQGETVENQWRNEWERINNNDLRGKQ